MIPRMVRRVKRIRRCVSGLRCVEVVGDREIAVGAFFGFPAVRADFDEILDFGRFLVFFDPNSLAAGIGCGA